MFRTRLGRLSLIVLLGVTATAGGLAFRAQGGLAEAEKLARHGRWPQARTQLARYLWLHPGDGRARLLMAEALVRDKRLDGDGSALAIEHLSRVADDSQHAAQARAEAGRLELLRQRPARAEALFRAAVRLDADRVDAHFMLWKILELTGRAQQSEEPFWQVYRHSGDAERMMRLREWYLSQFDVAAANALLDRMLGLLGESDAPSPAAAARRYQAFQAAEPDAVLADVALARWQHSQGNPQLALEILDEAAGKTGEVRRDPFYVATRVHVLLDMGRYEAAADWFADWPPPREGHEYRLAEAILRDEWHGDYQAAVAAYDRALAVWPGQVDWRTQARKANCLARMGRQEQAEQARAASQSLQQLLESPLHQRVREALRQMNDPRQLADVVTFYRRLGRSREADGWQQQIDRLQVTP